MQNFASYLGYIIYIKVRLKSLTKSFRQWYNTLGKNEFCRLCERGAANSATEDGTACIVGYDPIFGVALFHSQ